MNGGQDPFHDVCPECDRHIAVAGHAPDCSNADDEAPDQDEGDDEIENPLDRGGDHALVSCEICGGATDNTQLPVRYSADESVNLCACETCKRALANLSWREFVDLDSAEDSEALFREDGHWQIRATDMVPDGEVQPYLEINCPVCQAPNAFPRGLKKPDMPFNCVECGEEIRLRVSITAVESESEQEGDENDS